MLSQSEKTCQPTTKAKPLDALVLAESRAGLLRFVPFVVPECAHVACATYRVVQSSEFLLRVGFARMLSSNSAASAACCLSEPFVFQIVTVE